MFNMRKFIFFITALITGCASSGPKLSEKAERLRKFNIWADSKYEGSVCTEVQNFREIAAREPDQRDCEIVYEKYNDYLERSVDKGATHLKEILPVRCSSIVTTTLKCPLEKDFTETKLVKACEARNGVACWINAINSGDKNSEFFFKSCKAGFKKGCEYGVARKEITSLSKFPDLCRKKFEPLKSCTKSVIYLSDQGKYSEAVKMADQGCKAGSVELCEIVTKSKMMTAMMGSNLNQPLNQVNMMVDFMKKSNVFTEIIGKSLVALIFKAI